MRCSSDESPGDRRFTVYYDGDCPICAAEVKFYRAQEGGDEIRWIDASIAPPEALKGLPREGALKRLHARDETGALIEGAPAFTGIWARLPRLRRLGDWGARPAPARLLKGFYRVFLVARPVLARAARLVGFKGERG